MSIIDAFIKLNSNKSFLRYFNNTSWLILEKVFRLITAFFVGVWVARYLGPEQLGILSYAQSLVFLFSAFSTLGLDSIVVRELIKSPERKKVILGTAFLLKLFGSIISIGLIIVTIYALDISRNITSIVILISISTIFQSFYVIDFYFQSIVKSKFVVYAQLLSMLVVNILKILFILYDAPLTYFAIAACFDTALVAIGLFFAYKSSNELISKWQWNKDVALDLLRDSWPLILSSLMIGLYMKVDQVMIMQMLGADAVGQYSAAVRLSEAWYFIPIALSNSFFPALVNQSENNTIFYSRVQKLYDALFVVSFSVAMFFSVFSDSIITILYGDKYVITGEILAIHIWGGMFIAHGSVRGKYLIAINKQFIGLQFRTVGMILNLVLNYFLINKYGVVGAAYATIISYALPVYLLALFHKLLKEDIKMMWKAYSMFWLFRK